MKPDECYRLLKEACGRFFAADIPDQAAMIDCTPEIAGDITRELVKIWNFDMKYYQIDGVRVGTFILRRRYGLQQKLILKRFCLWLRRLERHFCRSGFRFLPRKKRRLPL